MDALTERAFDPEYAIACDPPRAPPSDLGSSARYGFFHVTSDQLLYPNPGSPMITDNHLKHFEFMGRILGKAIYSQILVR